MLRIPVTCVLALVCSSFVMAEGEPLEERVREAALRTYVHGMTMDIAQTEVGPEGVPVLLDLLRDPEFPRRDNLVAMLAYLGRDVDTPQLVALMDDSRITDERPENYRSRLLIPEALGRIANRGGEAARSALYGLESEIAAGENGSLERMIGYGIDLADRTLEVFPEPPADETPADPDAIDSNPNIHSLALTYANHVNTNSPINDAAVDALLESVSQVMATENGSNDTACCINLSRASSGLTFGTSGDGQDVITSSGEMSSVLNNSVARIKVVDLINWCGGAGSNIIGCGSVPGRGIALVRISGTSNEGKLWAHELGHNTGLGHNGSTQFIMYGSLSSGNTKLSASECNRYHQPSGVANLPVSVIGTCHDDDDDGIVSSIDNCPDDSNSTQGDSDLDLVGNSCDNCANAANTDQADCDGDGRGDVCDANSPVPPPIQDVGFQNSITLSWESSSSGTNIYRGAQIAGNPWATTAHVVHTAIPGSTAWDDSTQPGANRLLYYFVNSFNDCGESD